MVRKRLLQPVNDSSNRFIIVYRNMLDHYIFVPTFYAALCKSAYTVDCAFINALTILRSRFQIRKSFWNEKNHVVLSKYDAKI
jgi:hypothetical protein